MTESVQPLDNTRMKRREELALRLSVANGDLERARQAAERLFGLRLDTDTQVRLAGQMHQLGLHELAEAVLGRARRRAGNQASALVGMMVQYQRQGQLDVAVQVAMQILRSTSATRPSNPNVRAVDVARRQPHGRHQRAGAVRPAAAAHRARHRAAQENAQARSGSPDAGRLLPGLRPAREGHAPSWPASIALRPDDTALRLQVAQQLVQEDQAAAAVEHYKVLLQKEPACSRATSTRFRTHFSRPARPKS